LCFIRVFLGLLETVLHLLLALRLLLRFENTPHIFLNWFDLDNPLGLIFTAVIAPEPLIESLENMYLIDELLDPLLLCLRYVGILIEIELQNLILES
jgi:hypothetical protein